MARPNFHRLSKDSGLPRFGGADQQPACRTPFGSKAIRRNPALVDEVLRLGPGDQDARTDSQGQGPEITLPQNIGHRFMGHAPRTRLGAIDWPRMRAQARALLASLALRRRSERLERPNAHLYETGGLRRTHLRGHTNILKRLFVHAGGFNLGLLMRTRFGIDEAGRSREYDIRTLLPCILDAAPFDEYKTEYGQTLVCGCHGHDLHLTSARTAIDLRPSRHEGRHRSCRRSRMPSHTHLTLPDLPWHQELSIFPTPLLQISFWKAGKKIPVNIANRLSRPDSLGIPLRPTCLNQQFCGHVSQPQTLAARLICIFGVIIAQCLLDL